MTDIKSTNWSDWQSTDKVKIAKHLKRFIPLDLFQNETLVTDSATGPFVTVFQRIDDAGVEFECHINRYSRHKSNRLINPLHDGDVAIPSTAQELTTGFVNHRYFSTLCEYEALQDEVSFWHELDSLGERFDIPKHEFPEKDEGVRKAVTWLKSLDYDDLDFELIHCSTGFFESLYTKLNDLIFARGDKFNDLKLRYKYPLILSFCEESESYVVTNSRDDENDMYFIDCEKTVEYLIKQDWYDEVQDVHWAPIDGIRNCTWQDAVSVSGSLEASFKTYEDAFEAIKCHNSTFNKVKEMQCTILEQEGEALLLEIESDIKARRNLFSFLAFYYRNQLKIINGVRKGDLFLAQMNKLTKNYGVNFVDKVDVRLVSGDNYSQEHEDFVRRFIAERNENNLIC